MAFLPCAHVCAASSVCNAPRDKCCITAVWASVIHSAGMEPVAPLTGSSGGGECTGRWCGGDIDDSRRGGSELTWTAQGLIKTMRRYQARSKCFSKH